MKTFIDRNLKELLNLILCTAGAGVSLWVGLGASPGLEQLWFGLCWIVFASCTGYWVWAIFDNAAQNALEREANRLVDLIEQVEDPYLAAEVRRVLNGEEAQ